MTTQVEFVERCVAAAADLALFFVGAPENEMLVSLHEVRANLEAELAEAFGAEVAALMAQAFVAAVVGRRREIEAAGETPPPVLN
jgi:7-keto-8-aminopelargonate synthetase-like enzyme